MIGVICVSLLKLEKQVPLTCPFFSLVYSPSYADSSTRWPGDHLRVEAVETGIDVGKPVRFTA